MSSGSIQQCSYIAAIKYNLYCGTVIIVGVPPAQISQETKL